MKRFFSRLRQSIGLFKPDHQPDPAPPATSSSTSVDRGRPPVVQLSESAHQIETTHTNCKNLNSNAPLENLPPEVRRHLLSMMDFEALRALVHASPVYHEQYRLDRKHLLCQCLDITLRSVSLEACAVYRSGLITFSDMRTTEALTDFFESFQKEHHLASDYSIIDEAFTIDELICMSTFHSSIIIPLARHYVDWALGNLAKEPEISQSRINEPLSQIEETRLLRALYRFQLCCNIFGIGPHESLFKPSPDFEAMEVLQMLESLYEPWEIEEISCIYTFAEEKYKHIFEEISWDVNQENPKFDGQRPPTPEGAFDLVNLEDGYLKGTISRGLELLHTVLFKIKDHPHLVSTMQENISLFPGWFLGEDAFGQTTQHERRNEARSDRDVKQERQDPLPFQGDQVPDPDGVYPPLAWTWIWGGTYSSLLGCWIGDAIRRWGYVMWDGARLEGTGAREVVTRQIRAHWGMQDDPRDSMFY